MKTKISFPKVLTNDFKINTKRKMAHERIHPCQPTNK